MSNGYFLLHDAATLFLCAFTTLITETRVPSLGLQPGASTLVFLLLPVCYFHKYSCNKPLMKKHLITATALQ